MSPTSPLRRRLLATLALAPLLPWAPASAAARRLLDAPPLLLAMDAAPDIHPAGYLVSEKLDGVRAFWDGQQLRTRGGLAVAAPAWFLRRLPPVALDGELWAGYGRFEPVSGTVRRQRPDDAAWQALRFHVFELPGATGPFEERAVALARLVRETDAPGLQAVPQLRLADRDALQRQLQAVLALGGEGLMLHRADAPYLTGRNPVLQKLKPWHDAEAVVLGAVPGRGRHAGRMGALRVQTPQGRQFLLGTGFSDAERDAPPAPGTVLTYSYRGTTAHGLPRFASFLRVRSP
ncbi:MAG: DNA ligase [Rubrivivax sp.]|nr:DNA ligase [Rubrivivax sp.]